MKKLLLFTITFALAILVNAQDCSDLFISEYVEGSGNNKAIELYNPTDVDIDLAAYKLVRYRNGGFVPNDVQLSGIIEAKGTYVFALDKRDPNGTGFEQPIDSALMEKADAFLCPVYEVNKMMYFNGNDAVTLEKITGEIVDIFAMIGPPMLEDDNGWTNITDTTITWNNGGVQEEYTIQNYIVGPLFWLSWTEDHTLIRKASVRKGVTDNPAVFKVHEAYDSIPENTFDSLGFHTCDCQTFSIQEPQADIQVEMYPNPVQDGQFSISSPEQIRSVEIVNLMGSVVYRQQLSNMAYSMEVKLEQAEKGIYFVMIHFGNKSSQTRKIIIE
ncbi:MAG: lamin tail domain-containing protein [Bacteroidota bacterium]|nr:lamin tail domain-containing protein [Bacteroidota bacterium]